MRTLITRTLVLAASATVTLAPAARTAEAREYEIGFGGGGWTVSSPSFDAVKDTDTMALLDFQFAASAPTSSAGSPRATRSSSSRPSSTRRACRSARACPVPSSADTSSPAPARPWA